MKNFFRVFMLVVAFSIFVLPQAFAHADSGTRIKLTNEEQEWLVNNHNRVFILGLDPNSGIEYFNYKNEEKGYLIDLLKIIRRDLGIKIEIASSKSWGEAYYGLQNGSIDVLLGANETPDRKKIMAFTQPINRNSYAIIAKKDGTIHTIGDIDKKTIGFMKNDFIIDSLPKIYKHIDYKIKIYPSQEEGVAAVKNNEIDAFIMPGGPVVYDYIYRFPDLSYAFKIYAATSDMTFSTKIENKIFASILDKEISYLKKMNLKK